MSDQEPRTAAGWCVDDARRFKGRASSVAIHRIAAEIRPPQLTTDDTDTVWVRLSLPTRMFARARMSNDVALRPKGPVGGEFDQRNRSRIIRDREPPFAGVERGRGRKSAAARYVLARGELKVVQFVARNRPFLLWRVI